MLLIFRYENGLSANEQMHIIEEDLFLDSLQYESNPIRQISLMSIYKHPLSLNENDIEK